MFERKAMIETRPLGLQGGQGIEGDLVAAAAVGMHMNLETGVPPGPHRIHEGVGVGIHEQTFVGLGVDVARPLQLHAQAQEGVVGIKLHAVEDAAVVAMFTQADGLGQRLVAVGLGKRGAIGHMHDAHHGILGTEIALGQQILQREVDTAVEQVAGGGDAGLLHQGSQVLQTAQAGLGREVLGQRLGQQDARGFGAQELAIGRAIGIAAGTDGLGDQGVGNAIARERGTVGKGKMFRGIPDDERIGGCHLVELRPIGEDAAHGHAIVAPGQDRRVGRGGLGYVLLDGSHGFVKGFDPRKIRSPGIAERKVGERRTADGHRPQHRMAMRLDEPGIDHPVGKLAVDHVGIAIQPGLEVLEGADRHDPAAFYGHGGPFGPARVHGDHLARHKHLNRLG